MLHCVVNIFAVFTARHICIAQTMPWQNVCPSVCLSVTRRTKPDGNIPTGTPLTGAPNARVYEKITIFDQYLVLSRT